MCNVQCTYLVGDGGELTNVRSKGGDGRVVVIAELLHDPQVLGLCCLCNKTPFFVQIKHCSAIKERKENQMNLSVTVDHNTTSIPLHVQRKGFLQSGRRRRRRQGSRQPSHARAASWLRLTPSPQPPAQRPWPQR